MSFTYTAAIPQPNDIPSQSQDQILQNFQAINTANNVDKIDFNAGVTGDRGKSKYVHFKNSDGIIIPVPTTTSDEGALYAQSVNADSQLFWRFKNNGFQLQLTNNTINLVATPGATPLPGQMVMQWGSGAATTDTAFAFFQPFTSVVSIQVTPIQNSNNRLFVFIKTFSNNGFTVAVRDSGGSNTNCTLFYQAIGFR